MISNIKRGLGITTRLDWVKNIQTGKDTTSSIESSFPVVESSSICELFSQSGIDKLHRDLTQSFHINIPELNGFEKITIHNKGHCDVTIEIHKTNNAQLLVEVIDESTSELISTGLTFINHKDTNVQIATNTILGENKLYLAKHVCTTKENAQVVWFTQSSGTKQVVFDQKANLQGTHSSIKTISTVSGNNGDKFDIATISHHIAEHTHSDIIFKSVLKDTKVLARGLVRIEPSASNSQGYQKSNILLLDDKAQAITIPDLEIENKDVMCSHGSTITSIDNEKMFYLKSRGLEEKVAKELIVKGFIDDIYAQISTELQNELRGKRDEE